jgi:tRNA1Val (adenine37-N6)-methyltransferase
MPNSWFQFKQFKINQAQNAMKVTTDACVFGALADFSNRKQILDIGGGTGLLSLMLAQRFSDSRVTGIEIDEASFLEMQQNFTESPWSDRLKALHMNILDFAENEEKYDGIISNPPFFHSSLTSENLNKNRVRHSDQSLTVSDLLKCVAQLLTPNGKFICLYPHDREAEVITTAIESGLNLKQTITLQNTIAHTPHRVILEFGFAECKQPHNSTFYIRNPDNRGYSKDVVELMKPFYL